MKARKPLLVLIVALALGAAGYYFHANRNGSPAGVVRVSGNIELTDVEVSFKIPGRVVARPVDEGQRVEQGQVLARLDTSDLDQDVELRRAELEAASAALSELKNGSRPEEIAAAEGAMKKAQALLAELEAGSRPQEIEAAQAAVTSAEIEEARLKAEYVRAESIYRARTGAITEEELQRQRAAYDVAFARLTEARQKYALVKEGPRKEQIEQARAALAQAKAQYELVKVGPRQEDIDQAAAKVGQAKAALRLAEIRRDDYAVLRSPLTGIVLSKNIEPGEYVSPGTPVVTVGDMVNVWLRAYVPETEQGQVKQDQPVRVTTDAHPGKVYQGRVSFISSEAEFTPKSVQTPKERIKLVYRIKVEIQNPNLELKRGMPADGEIEVE